MGSKLAYTFRHTMVTTLLDSPAGTFRAIPAPAGGYRVEIVVRHGGAHALVDLYQETGADPGSLLHPHDGPPPFRACPSAAAPGWTCVGAGLAPGENVEPFVAWCANPPEAFAMRWRAEDAAVGGAFDVVAERP